MIPKAKKNLHECEYHLNKMLHSRHVEELEINLDAFVNSARNVTFVLQKEFKKNPIFKKWYPTKVQEMSKDSLCKFFKNLRNSINKEGINKLRCSTHINSFNSSTDIVNPPLNAGLAISSKGMYWHINKGTPQEDFIPASSKAKMTTQVFIEDAPKEHLGKNLKRNDVINLSQIYYSYLKSLVEEFTAVLNKEST